MNQHRSALLLVALAVAVVAGYLASTLETPAHAQNAYPRNNAINDIAAGTAVLTSALTSDADTTTAVFNFDTIGTPSAANALPIPDFSVGVLRNFGASGFCTCCLFDDYTDSIGAQASDATMLQVSGVDSGTCWQVPSGGSPVPFRENHVGRQAGPGYQRGVCSLPTDHDRATDLRIYLSCTNDADCASVAGTPAGATCSAGATLDPTKGLARAAFAGCRCTAASLVTIGVER